MKVFALSDPHLSFGTPNKTMDRFGPQWVDHWRKIEASWRERVGERDLVVVPGDVSWAMTLEQAQPDLDFLGRLPGRKVLAKGNHDYWWGTITKVRRALPPSLHALQGDAVRIDGVAIAATRLWDSPEFSFGPLIDWKPNPAARISMEQTSDDAAESVRIFERELGRLERALAALDQAASGGALRIAATHYPPCGADLAPSRATALFERHGVRHSVFGHLHSLRRDLPRPPFGTSGAVTYTLASCDWIDFAPVLLAET
jgi:predicted phosphohydrolase